MTDLNFPDSPNHGDVYGKWAWDAPTNAWMAKDAVTTAPVVGFVFETIADATAANIPPGVNSITIRRRSAGDILGNIPYTRGNGLLGFNDAANQPWQLDPYANPRKASWWGINGVRYAHNPPLNPWVDETSKLQALADVSSGYSVEIDSLIPLSTYVVWRAGTKVFGQNNSNYGFIAYPDVNTFYRGLAQVNGSHLPGVDYTKSGNRVSFKNLVFRGNLIEPIYLGYTCGAIFIAADSAIGSPLGGMEEIEISDCVFRDFKTACWVYVVVGAHVGDNPGTPGVEPTYYSQPVHILKVVRNVVIASQYCATSSHPTDLTGNYFMRIHGNSGVDEPSVEGVVSNILFAHNQIFGDGLAGVLECLYNSANYVCSHNISEGIGNFNSNVENKVYCYSFYASNPTSVDPYNITFNGNVIAGSVNCGIYAAGCRNIAVSGNVFRDNKTQNGALLASGCSGYAIAANGARNIVITGNEILNSPGGIYLGQDHAYESVDVCSGNSINVTGDAYLNGTGIRISPDVSATPADKFSSMVVANNNISVFGVGSAGIYIVGTTTAGRLKIAGNHVRSDGQGIIGPGQSGPMVGVVELTGNSISGRLNNYAYNFWTDSPLIIKDEFVDWSEINPAVASSGAFFAATQLSIDGLTMINKANSSLGGSAAITFNACQGTMKNVEFKNIATKVTAGSSMGLGAPTFPGSQGNVVQNLAPVEIGAPKYVVKEWINVGGASAWLEQRMPTGNP